MSDQAIIDSLQVAATTLPRTDVWASPVRRIRLDGAVQYSSAFARANKKAQNNPQADLKARSKHKWISRLALDLLGDGDLYDNIRENSERWVHPMDYLRTTHAGLGLIDWLSEQYERPANVVIRYLTNRYNDQPLPANQDVRIDRDPVHAWVALREPIIDRIVSREGFAGLLQKQERILVRLGAIWDHTMSAYYDQPSFVQEFNSRLTEHVRTLLGNTPFTAFHIGYLPEIFFRYEILLHFCSSYGEKTGVGALLEAKRPALKLYRLVSSKATHSNP